jgi:hypothetical protein
MSDLPTSDPLVRLKERRCRYLVSKEMFYDNGIPLEERSGSGIFWCSQTHKCLGPDNTSVSAEECLPTRSCYER